MWFSLMKVAERLRKHIVLYFVLILQIAIGLTFIIYALNHIYSSKQRERVLKRQMDEGTVTVNAYVKPGVLYTEEPAVTYEDYQELKRITQDDVEFYIYKHNSFLVENEFLDVPVIFTDIKQSNGKESIAFYGEDIANILKMDIDSEFSFFKISAGKLIMKADEKQYELNPLGSNLLDREILSQHVDGVDINLKECILLPLKDYQIFEQEDIANSILRISFNDSLEMEQQLLKVQEYLDAGHGQYYQYEYVNFLDSYEIVSESLTKLSVYYAKMAVAMLAILLIGFTGVTKIFVKKREKELAICMTLGGTRSRLCMELFAEILCICMLGGGIGSVVGTVLTMQTEISAFDMVCDWRSIVVAAGIALLSTILIVYPSIKRIFTMRPTELLQTI